jgi:hypothetical protein
MLRPSRGASAFPHGPTAPPHSRAPGSHGRATRPRARRTPFPSGFAVFIDYSELSSSLPWSRGAAPVVPTLGSRGASAFVLYSLAPNIPGSGPLYRHHVKQQPLYGASAPGRCNYTSVGVFTVGPLPQGAGRPKTFGRSSAASRPCFATSVAKARAGKGVDPTPTGASQCARPLSSLRAKADLDRTTTRGASCGPPRKSEACVACPCSQCTRAPR